MLYIHNKTAAAESTRDASHYLENLYRIETTKNRPNFVTLHKFK